MDLETLIEISQFSMRPLYNACKPDKKSSSNDKTSEQLKIQIMVSSIERINCLRFFWQISALRGAGNFCIAYERYFLYVLAVPGMTVENPPPMLPGLPLVNPGAVDTDPDKGSDVFDLLRSLVSADSSADDMCEDEVPPPYVRQQSVESSVEYLSLEIM